jgi:uncharacterized cupin superfamily protein
MKPVVNIADVALRESSHGDKFAAKLGRIGALIGAQKLGCQLHIVPSGKTAFPRHAHHANEEMFLILEGEGQYRFGPDTYPIKKGDVLAAPAGIAETTAHQILNTGADELHYLAFSTRNDPDVVEYADSNKFLVSSMVPPDGGLRGAKVMHIARPGTSLDYWDGE